ncbi:MAG TPA: hypothetical protein VJ044_08175, partial [Candidatus Hodarchaeales archaeon]|nr:hypothetical protein [Candidatus Hodarchaeales archaeon]
MSKSDILVCPGIRSSHQDANIVKNILLREKCLEKRCQIRHEGKFVIFPLIKGKSEVVRDLLPEDSELVDSEGFFLRSTKESPISFLRKNLPKEVIAFIPSSYDVVGDVVLLKLDAHLIPSKELIAEAFLRYNNARTVLNKIADVSTEFRTPQWEVIGGSPRTDTIITLHGMKLSVDVARSYFNPRLGNEYQRIANLINDGETVWDLFCGVGPFSILGAIRSPATFLANDLNPVAVGCLKTNIEMNSKKLRGEVKPSNRDVMDLIQDDLPMPKRVIMNLPGRS